MRAYKVPTLLIAIAFLAAASLWAQVGATGPEHPVTISRGSARVQNCGKNFDCFIKAFDEGRAVRVEQVRTGNLRTPVAWASKPSESEIIR